MMRGSVAAGAGAGVKGVEVRELNACGKADSIAEISLKRFVASKEQTRGWFLISISLPMDPIMAPYWVPDIIRGLADAVPQFCPSSLSTYFNIIHPF
jgi:hypothetical protein